MSDVGVGPTSADGNDFYRYLTYPSEDIDPYKTLLLLVIRFELFSSNMEILN